MPSDIMADSRLQAEPTGMVAFGGGADATLLNQLAAMVQAGQLSNMAAYVPTDCPTREKHAWLGDALDVAEELAYNFWAAPMLELFLDTIRAEQTVGGTGDGNVPVNVPAGPTERPMDISWTAAYPMIAHWLYVYYGDIGVIHDHWPTLKRYVDGQRRQKGGAGADLAVPDFWNFVRQPRLFWTISLPPPLLAACHVPCDVPALHHERVGLVLSWACNPLFVSDLGHQKRAIGARWSRGRYAHRTPGRQPPLQTTSWQSRRWQQWRPRSARMLTRRGTVAGSQPIVAHSTLDSGTPAWCRTARRRSSCRRCPPSHLARGLCRRRRCRRCGPRWLPTSLLGATT